MKNKTGDGAQAQALQVQCKRGKREEMLDYQHMKDLKKFVEGIRNQLGQNYAVPHFDPTDGGKEAKALFVLEATGPKAKKTNYISRDNPDPTATSMRKLLDETGFEKHETILWNIVPWYIYKCENGKERIRPPTQNEVELGSEYLKELIDLLPNLKVVVLVGRSAQRAWPEITLASAVRMLGSKHPSRKSRNDQAHIREVFKVAKAWVEVQE